MKYSFLLPYHKRDTLTETAKSFLEFYSNRNDYELIIVESRRTWENEVEHNKLLNIIKEFESKMSIKHYKNMDTGYSCSVAYNIAFKNSSGDFLVVTNPECYHTINILGEFDKLFEENKNCYIICACEAVNPDKTHFSWYQHSIHMNRMLHFCTAISKRNWLRTNGFCEALAGGTH